MRERSSVDIFAAGGVVAACGVAGYLLQESDRHINSEINYATGSMVCTGRLRFTSSEDGCQHRFFDVATVLPLEDVSEAKREQGIAITKMVHAYITGSDADPRGCADAIAVLPCRDDDFVSRTIKQRNAREERVMTERQEMTSN
jgi:hypothetical protein